MMHTSTNRIDAWTLSSPCSMGRNFPFVIDPEYIKLLIDILIIAHHILENETEIVHS